MPTPLDSALTPVKKKLTPSDILDDLQSKGTISPQQAGDFRSTLQVAQSQHRAAAPYADRLQVLDTLISALGNGGSPARPAAAAQQGQAFQDDPSSATPALLSSPSGLNSRAVRAPATPGRIGSRVLGYTDPGSSLGAPATPSLDAYQSANADRNPLARNLPGGPAPSAPSVVGAGSTLQSVLPSRVLQPSAPVDIGNGATQRTASSNGQVSDISIASRYGTAFSIFSPVQPPASKFAPLQDPNSVANQHLSSNPQYPLSLRRF